MPSKPDFVLYINEGPPNWSDVELVFEHTRSSQDTVTTKFLQWLRNACSVFHHQPFRRHLYGIIFKKPYAFVCYADHGCAVYSKPLDFVKVAQHTQFLIDFLTGFIANPEHRGRDPTVQELDEVHIHHAGRWWVEFGNLLWYRPCLIGRNIRVAQVQLQSQANILRERVVMKSSWEEILPPESSPPSEIEVLKILLDANVRGLPQPYTLDHAIVKDNSGLEVVTRSFPENYDVALQASTKSI